MRSLISVLLALGALVARQEAQAAMARDAQQDQSCQSETQPVEQARAVAPRHPHAWHTCQAAVVGVALCALERLLLRRHHVCDRPQHRSLDEIELAAV